MADFTIMTWNIQQFGKQKGSKNDYRYDFILQILQATNKTPFTPLGLPNKIPDIFVIVELSDPYGPEILKNLTEDINGSLPSGTTTEYGYICSASQITKYDKLAKTRNGNNQRTSSERIGFIYNTDLFTPFDPSSAQAPTEFPIYDVTEIKSSSPQNNYVAGKMRKRSFDQIEAAFPGARPPAIAHFSVNHSGNNNSKNKNPLVILAWHTAPAPSTAWHQINSIFGDIKDNKTLSSIPNDELIKNPFIVTGDLNIDSKEDKKYYENLESLFTNTNNFSSAIEQISTHNSNKGLDYIYYNNVLELLQDSKVYPLDNMVFRILTKNKKKGEIVMNNIINQLKRKIVMKNTINQLDDKTDSNVEKIVKGLTKIITKTSSENETNTTVKMITDTVSDHYPILAKFNIK